MSARSATSVCRRGCIVRIIENLVKSVKTLSPEKRAVVRRRFVIIEARFLAMILAMLVFLSIRSFRSGPVDLMWVTFLFFGIILGLGVQLAIMMWLYRRMFKDV
jgi:hypothetical protein